MRRAMCVVFAAACGGRATPPPVMLAPGHTSATNLAVDATNVYWIDYQPGPAGSYAVMSVAKSGGAPTTLYTSTATNQGFGGFQIAVASGLVVFAIEQHTASNNDAATLLAVPVGGGDATTLAATPAGQNMHILALVADDRAAYWIDDTGQGTLHAIPLGGGTPVTLASNLAFMAVPNNNQLAQDATTLYLPTMSFGGASGAIVAVSKTTGATTMVAPATHCCALLAVVGSTLYFTQIPDTTAELLSVPVAGGSPTTITTWDSTKSDNAYALAADPTHVFFAAAPAVWEVPLSADTVEQRVTTLDGNEALVLDGANLFYADRGVHRLAVD